MNTPIRTYRTLAEAIDFIAGCLERNAPEELYGQFGLTGHAPHPDFEKFSRWSFFHTVFPDLQKRHHDTDIRTVYQEREFPTGEDRLHLGGHFAELGCIHIIFVRTPQGWVLDEILMCR